MTGRLHLRRAVRAGVLVLLGLFVIWSVQSWDGDGSFFSPSRMGSARESRPSDAHRLRNEAAGEQPHRAPAIELPSYCNNLKIDFSKIAIITKTGATEARDKLPPQLSTCLSCVPDPLIFSDLDQSIDGFQIHDVLSRVSKATKVDNPEFDIYYAQKGLVAEGREDEMKALGKRPILSADWRTRGKSAAWALDKYKFLHMIDRAWEYQPNRDWYVFIETDTYLSLPNLVKFLAMQNPKAKLYLGNAVQMFEHITPLSFAHGGSGFILSGATVEEFAVANKGLSLKFDRRIMMSWYGDYVVADALDEFLNVRVTDAEPMLQGNDLTNLPFAEETWCRTAVTLHYMKPADFAQIFEYERSHEFQPMRYRDLYSLAYHESFPSRRAAWDNGSNEARYLIPHPPPRSIQAPGGDFIEAESNDPHSSFFACELACILKAECMQFSFRTFAEKDGAECHLSKAIRLGKEAQDDDPEPGDSVSSGWMNEKIEAFISSRPQCPG